VQGRPFEVVTSDGAKVTTAFGLSTTGNAIGTTVTVTDQANKQRRSITNALGQLTRVDEPNNAGQLDVNGVPAQPTNYVYDTLNNLVTVVQGEQIRTFAYDSLSRLKSANNPESGLINYSYDNNGNLTSKTDARQITTNYVYDNLNRVKTRSYSDNTTPNVAYTYDNLTNAKGKLIKVANGISETRYLAFDILGRVTSSQQKTDGVTYDPQSYVYNLSGALIEETYPSGRVVKNTLDVDGDLAQVQSRKSNGTLQNYANAFTYTSAGAVSSMRLGNGKFENTQFNSRLQPIQIGLGSSATSQNLLKLNFDYGVADNNGNVKSQTITTPTVGNIAGFVAMQNYTYDSLNRLKSAVENVSGQANSNWNQVFKYDRYGNREFDTNTNNTTNMLSGCPVNVCNPTASPANNKLVGTNYDVVGNTKVDANGQVFTYDAENKQTKVVNAQGVMLGEYFYDGDGKRIKKYVPSTSETTIFVYDAGGKMVAEYSTVTALQSEAKISYLTNDHLGSPRITTDSLGKVISKRDFMPFGEEIPRAGNGSDSVRQKFTGYERDAETSLDYAKARMFGSGLGRFTSPDPYNIIFESQIEKDKAQEKLIAYLKQPQQWNRYVYVVNNPLNYTDPTGEILELTGTRNEQTRSLARIMNLLGEKASKNLHIEFKDGHTLVTYSGTGGLAVGGEVGAVIEEIIDSKTTVEYQMTYDDKVTFADGSTDSIRANGGGITRILSKDRIQIFVGGFAGKMATETAKEQDMKGDDGKLLTQTNETADAHEFGHAWGAIKDNFSEKYNNLYPNQYFAGQALINQNKQKSVMVENMARERLGLPKRLKH
jgi:RHS repeat-associated protein